MEEYVGSTLRLLPSTAQSPTHASHLVSRLSSPGVQLSAASTHSVYSAHVWMEEGVWVVQHATTEGLPLQDRIILLSGHFRCLDPGLADLGGRHTPKIPCCMNGSIGLGHLKEEDA